MHAILDCPDAAAIWRAVVPFDKWNEFFSADLVSCIDGNLDTKNMPQV